MFKSYPIEMQKMMLEVRIANLEGRHGRENKNIVNKLRRRLRVLGE